MRSKPQVLCAQVLLSRLWCCLELGDPLKAGPYGEKHRPWWEGSNGYPAPQPLFSLPSLFPSTKCPQLDSSCSRILLCHKPLNNRVKKTPLGESTKAVSKNRPFFLDLKNPSTMIIYGVYRQATSK